ncbi:MAG: type II toxin-antitoxin system VapC family toxin [Chloroflexi bacterium]|jgi:predicted nucleic acid-binding protein|nr:MAG: type II toxin-antitoxin system VapC family toxin [Chloroflexota bacterium]TMF47598.1 MAG: type II toxin-antitoxin system VapC family toxin [Chloroflexota bacterium]
MMTSTADIQRIFVDTSAWIDLMNKNERNHAEAIQFHKNLSPLTLRITSWGIVSETFTWIRYHIGGQEAFRWLSMKESLEQQGFLQIVFPDAQMEIGVRKVIDRFRDQALSYVDAFSIALVQSRPDIDAIFAFDHHMILAGRPVLPGLLE